MTGKASFTWATDSSSSGKTFEILGPNDSAAAFLTVANDGKLCVSQDAVFKSDAVVRGSLTVLGTTSTIHTQDFAVKDSEIVIGHYEYNTNDTSDNPTNMSLSAAEGIVQGGLDMKMCFGLHSDKTDGTTNTLLGGCIKFDATKGWELYQASGLPSSMTEAAGTLKVNGHIRCKNKLVITSSYNVDGVPDTATAGEGAVELKYVPASNGDKAYVVLQEFDNTGSNSTKIFARFYEQN